MIQIGQQPLSTLQFRYFKFQLFLHTYLLLFLLNIHIFHLLTMIEIVNSKFDQLIHIFLTLSTYT